MDHWRGDDRPDDHLTSHRFFGSAILSLSDEELLAQLQQGKLQALELLYDRYHRLLLALAYRVVGDQQVAEEVVQEVFLAVWRRSASYQPGRGKVRQWLLSIVRNRAIDRVRGNLKPSQTAELDESLTDPSAPEAWEYVDQSLQRERVRAELATLPAQQREVIELAYYGGLTLQQISDQTQVPLGTIKSRTRLAMDKLRQALRDLAEGSMGSC